MENIRQPSILLIDDRAENLESLATKLRAALKDSRVDIRKWLPDDAGIDLFDTFTGIVDDRTVLVVTDYDLTTTVRGFFGGSVVDWSQQKLIPAGDFSRRHKHMLPAEPKLFELRVPSNDDDAAPFIANAFVGFEQIRSGLSTNDGDDPRKSLGSALSNLLGRDHLESQFAAYMVRVGSANSALAQQVSTEARDGEAFGRRGNSEKVRLMTYVLGHVMLNSILKYPGPILSSKALCAYFGTVVEEISDLSNTFKGAKYAGPFDGGDEFFWRETVDEIIDGAADYLAAETFDDFGDYNRAVVERVLKRPLKSHDCPRDKCSGRKGGFWCPFTLRPVCVRADCSVPSSSWIPDGAQLSRVERDFYDEWAPLLGL